MASIRSAFLDPVHEIPSFLTSSFNIGTVNLPSCRTKAKFNQMMEDKQIRSVFDDNSKIIFVSSS